MIELKNRRNTVLLLAGLLAVSVTNVAAEDRRTLGSLSSIIKPNQSVGIVAPGDAHKVTMHLTERGMQDIRNLRREGEVYRAEASWYGETVDVQVDAATGEIKQPTRLSGKQVEFLLRDLGWQRIRRAERAGDTFSIRAQREGQLFDLKIDARTGTIIEINEEIAPKREMPTSGETPQP